MAGDPAGVIVAKKSAVTATSGRPSTRRFLSPQVTKNGKNRTLRNGNGAERSTICRFPHAGSDARRIAREIDMIPAERRYVLRQVVITGTRWVLRSSIARPK